MKTGKKHNYNWVVFRDEIKDLEKIIIGFHKNCILHLASFDGNLIIPNYDELKAGWTTDGEIMVSPLILDNFIFSSSIFSEWYLSYEKLIFPKDLIRFVNYSGFNLSPEFKDSLEIQTKFWEQLIKINPITFYSNGDNDIVVSKNEELIKYIINNV